jgi:hypothetical protein
MTSAFSSSTIISSAYTSSTIVHQGSSVPCLFVVNSEWCTLIGISDLELESTFLENCQEQRAPGNRSHVSFSKQLWNLVCHACFEGAATSTKRACFVQSMVGSSERGSRGNGTVTSCFLAALNLVRTNCLVLSVFTSRG